MDSGAVYRDDAVAESRAAAPATYVLGEQPLVRPLNGQEASFYRTKRAVDAVVAGLLLLALLPLLPIIALAILIDSGFPIIYSQQRVKSRRILVDGEWVWRLEPFTFYKFRTMYQGVVSTSHERYMAAYIAGDEATLAQLRPDDTEKAGTYKLLEDPRVTPVGRILRGLSIDELPQLWNVLVGDMSLVGPRPPIPYEVALYRPQDMERFASLPGVTGLWQVSGRSELSFDEMIALDTDYIRRQTLGLDLKILLQTMPAVVSRKGAG